MLRFTANQWLCDSKRSRLLLSCRSIQLWSDYLLTILPWWRITLTLILKAAA